VLVGGVLVAGGGALVLVDGWVLADVCGVVSGA
jgi:hypothetical protein